MDNFLYIPFLNPVKFVKVGRSNLAIYNTKQFDEYLFKERLYPWQQPEDYVQVWQTTDIISLQFESTFDPIIVQLVDKWGNEILSQPALIGLPNKFLPGTFSFEVSMQLAGLTTGCYKMRVLAGSGSEQQVYESGRMYISAEPLPGTILTEYYHKRSWQDVMFETGIKFQLRLPGHLGMLIPGANLEKYKDQVYNSTTLNARSFRQWPLIYGDEYGLPDDELDRLNRIWTCSNVTVDGKLMAVVDGKFEFKEVTNYPKRGAVLLVEEGLNRRSAVFALETDTTKRLVTSIIVEAKVFGDTSNQGSANTVPVINIE